MTERLASPPFRSLTVHRTTYSPPSVQLFAAEDWLRLFSKTERSTGCPSVAVENRSNNPRTRNSLEFGQECEWRNGGHSEDFARSPSHRPGKFHSSKRSECSSPSATLREI